MCTNEYYSIKYVYYCQYNIMFVILLYNMTNLLVQDLNCSISQTTPYTIINHKKTSDIISCYLYLFCISFANSHHYISLCFFSLSSFLLHNIITGSPCCDFFLLSIFFLCKIISIFNFCVVVTELLFT